LSEPDRESASAAGGSPEGLEPAASAAVTKERPLGILIVDDDPSVRAMLEMGLRHHGFVVSLASQGQEALVLYRDHAQEIDIVLLDVRMPGMDGPQTLAALRQINPQVRCCFVSGETGDYTQEALLALGAAHYFKKPFSLSGVTQVLRQLVENTPPKPC
jgi:DNA-binding response OmpR family regulator